MKFNICVVQPENYVHSRAFDEIALLIVAGLKDLGHIAELNPNKIDQSAKNIIIGCHLLDNQSATIIPKDTIVINTEQLSDEIGSWNKNIMYWLNKYESWDYSQKNIDNVVTAGVRPPKLLRLGYHESLKKINNYCEQDVDVLFYGSMNDRRRNILARLIKSGLTVKTLFGQYGDERDYWIARSKLVLNIHFYETHIFEIVRCFYLMTNSKAIVSEITDASTIDPIYRNALAGCAYEDIVKTCQYLIEQNERRKLLEEEAYSIISKNPQSLIMDKLLNDK